jgi:hypothetical protein
VKGQYTFDKNKIDQIRWSPVPDQVAGIENHKIDLNGQWHFSSTPKADFWKTEAINQWNTIEVPGEWVMQGFDVNKGKQAGYYRQFNLPAKWLGSRIKLKCEAIYSDCKIWVNGEEAGSHLGGFTPFEFDITDHVNQGKNSIAVAVASESLADTLSSASQYAVHPLGGITRPIYLVALPKVNVASFHVSTHFDNDYKDADLKVEMILANESIEEQEATLEFSLHDAKGNTVQLDEQKQTSLKLVNTEKQHFTSTFHVNHPLKWDCEHPNLYFLKCRLLIEGKETLSVTRRFGFRQIDVRGNQVFINNKAIKLKGVCRHEVDPLRGRSLSGNQWYEDVKLFKEGNVNYIRTSHYPPSEKLMEACDELGMFVEEEAPFCWASKKPVTNNNYFEAIIQPTLEMVERDKSHPCIIHWSLGNESYDFKELYQTSADLVKIADPTRPRIFSQYGEDSDGGYLELGNHHYPGSTGPSKYKDNRRPITFDEYCHLNAYNRYELMTDPGIRDFWGEILLNMWEGMYTSKGVLGGALWAGIDDSFFLPSGHVVGYGTWGPVDGWRRPKPEYWHMKKIFSPIKVKLLDGHPDSLVTLEIENRFLFTNLNECRFSWKNENEKGLLPLNIKTGKKDLVKIPITYSSMQKLSVDIFKDSDIPVDQYLFNFSTPEIEIIPQNKEKFKWCKDKSMQIAKSNMLEIAFNNKTCIIKNAQGDEIINEWPTLMLVPLNNGGDTQMTKDTPNYPLFSPEANSRKIESIQVEKTSSEIRITLKENYAEAIGKIVMIIHANGNIDLNYAYNVMSDLNLRQRGLSFSLPNSMNTLTWKRKGLWSVYPDDHIGRLNGTCELFKHNETCGLAGPSSRPSWGYNEDQTKYGSNDFRSTKRNVYFASLTSKKSSGLKVNSDGMQHVRCWAENDQVQMLVSEQDNPGAERFLRGFANHASKYDQPLKQGQSIQGKIKLQILNSKH